jgi:signal transduction histidine kinase
MLYYIFFRRNISPAPTLSIPVYDAALAGYLTWAIALPSVVMTAGLIAVGVSGNEGAFSLASNFLPSIVVFVLAVTLGEVVRTRRALTASAAERLRLLSEERAAEERLRIARELHDTVAHSMATIAVQAGSALHLLQSSRDVSAAEAALSAIRETSKDALTQTRAVLGQLRHSAAVVPGLDHLPALRDAVTSAGLPVSVSVSGTQVRLPADADHAAYRIVQESLTNVLRHAGPGACAQVDLVYDADQLRVKISDDGGPAVPSSTGGHGINGMRERAVAVGGSLTAGPGQAGFLVDATIPLVSS